MLLSDMVIDAIDATFQRGEIALNRVRADADAILIAHVFFRAVIYLIVLASHQRTSEHGARIRHNMGIFSNHLMYDWFQILSSYALDMPGLYASSAL